ncbi:MAG: CooT family nickel-binding protein [Clostridiales Family XIII bacterium]|jgi:predicted RNA-binding protein|nr:CooT family nickel-binding protein [Clostridiales Family XIII bacterium]
MCLSTVYKGDAPDPAAMILEYVTNIDIEGDLIRLYDITGEVKELRGAIRAVDLIRNTVLVAPA